MNRSRLRPGATLLVLALLFAPAACGGSDKKSSPPTTAPGDDPTTSAGGGGDTTAPTDTAAEDTSGGGTEEAADCVVDSDRQSGSSTVMWTFDSESEHQTDEATADTTLLLQADGSLEPSELTVKVGEVFTFGLAEDQTEIAAIIVGCSSGQTVYTGPALAAYYITTPGTYDISNELNDDKKLGTVTVE